MTFKIFPVFDARVTEYLAQAGVLQTKGHQTMTLLDVPGESKVVECQGPHFRKYKEITTPNGNTFELEYFRKETQGRLLLKIPALQEE